MPTISIRPCTQTIISDFSQFIVLYIAFVLYYLYRFSYSSICFFSFLRETIFFIICFFYLFLPYFIPINVYFVFFALVWRKLLFLVWRFYSIKGHLYNNKRRNVPYNHTIDSFAQKSVFFPSVFLPQCPHSRFFFCKRSFFRAKNLRRSYSSFTKASAFRTKRSFFRTKSRLSFCSSLPFETHRIYSHLLQTKFLSRKK